MACPYPKMEAMVNNRIEHYKKHSQQVETLLQNAQDAFSVDHTRIVLMAGIVMIAAILGQMIFLPADTLSITALVWGALLTVAALYFRHRSAAKHLAFTRALIDMERDRAGFARKMLVIQNLLREKLWDRVTLEQLQVLLGEMQDAPEGNGLLPTSADRAKIKQKGIAG